MRDMLKLTMMLLVCTVLALGCDKAKEEEEEKPPAAKKAPPEKAPPEKAPPEKAPPEKAPPEKAPPVSPAAAEAKTVVLAVLGAMEKGDAEAGLKHVEAPAAVKEFFQKSLPAMAQIAAFVRAGQKAYGDKPWKDALTAAELEGLAEDLVPIAAEAAKTLKIEVKDDKGTATWQGNDEPWNLVKKDGVWKVALPVDAAPPKDKQDEALGQFKAMGAAAAATQKKIGQPGVTAKQVIEALFAELKKALGEKG